MAMNNSKKAGSFFKGPFLWFTAAAGVLLLFYGMYFQTEGFTIRYTSFSNCFVAVMFGVVLGTLLMRYLKKQTLPDPEQPLKRRVTRKEIGAMMVGFLICFYACIALLYIATNMMMFYGTITVGALCLFCFWYYLIWGGIENKKAKNAD